MVDAHGSNQAVDRGSLHVGPVRRGSTRGVEVLWRPGPGTRDDVDDTMSTWQKVVVSGFLLMVMAACRKGETQPTAGQRPDKRSMQYPVEVITVAPRRVEYSVNAVGSVEAFERVQVTARVAGAVEKVLFAEGDSIRVGQVLVEIEPERYRVAVAAAKAVLERVESVRADAEGALARRETANANGHDVYPREELETLKTRIRIANADLSQAKAALALAELNLKDAVVRAPTTGVVQTRSVQTGQYVQPGALLATFLRREPLLLRFQVAEHEAAQFKTGQRANFTVRGSARALTAVITAVAESAEVGSRMVSITAHVDDPERTLLRPGTFAEVTVPVGATQEGMLAPLTAIRPSEKGFLAFVVQDGRAVERVLTLGLKTADGEVEVKSGISPGETLVVRGNEALSHGVPVRVEVSGVRSPTAAKTTDETSATALPSRLAGGPINVESVGRKNAPGDASTPDAGIARRTKGQP